MYDNTILWNPIQKIGIIFEFISSWNESQNKKPSQIGLFVYLWNK